MPTRACIEWSIPLAAAAAIAIAAWPAAPAAAPPEIVLYASDVPASSLHGRWSAVTDPTSPNGTKLITPAGPAPQTANALAAPADYADVTFTANAGTPYTLWLRVQATSNSKYSDSLWVQFSDAQVSGAPVYALNTSAGLLVNLANDATGASDQGWGWVNGAYWLVQSTTVTFATSGSHTLRLQPREYGVAVDQVVLSPATYLTSPPGPISNDATIVPKPGSSSTGSSSTGTTSSSSGLSPYTGTPAAVPGTVQAANFDNGGEGVAYHDSTPGNAGAAYRQTDVDIELSSEGGYDVGWTAPGEWTNYTVAVASTGNYIVRLRTASPGGATMHVGFNGPSAGVWPSVAIPATGGWQNWTTVSVPVSLHAGVQQLTIYFDTGGVNLAFVTVDPDSGASNGTNGSLTPYTGSAAPIPGTIQAVNFDNGGEGVAYHDATPGNTGGAYRSTGVDIQQSAQGGFNVGWIDSGEWLNYSVNVAAAGSYTVALQVAAPASGGSLHVGFNGPSTAWVGATVPGTGGWQNWATIVVPVTLGAGPQVLTLYFDTGGFNVASMNVTANAGPGGTTTGIPPFSHVYIIVMENHEFSDVIGNPAAPYLNQLAAQYGLATNYAGVTHPSLPNYMAMTGGNTAFTTDCVGCTVNTPNIADQLEAAGLSWKAYMEDMPAPCGTSDTTLYGTKHDPFIHYVDIVSNATRCQTHVVPLTTWRTDLSAGATPRFVWITPNLCSDMHDCDVSTGDAWLTTIVPQIMSTPDFGTSALFIVWDEGTTNSDGGGLIPLVVVSPLVAPGFRSSAFANHFSLLRTIEDAWGLPALGQAAGARSLSEFFQR